MSASLRPNATSAMNRALSPTLICFAVNELTCERMIGWGTDHEPEPGGLGLLSSPLHSGLSTIVFELVEVRRPFLAV